jgi:hypothetical protein
VGAAIVRRMHLASPRCRSEQGRLGHAKLPGHAAQMNLRRTAVLGSHMLRLEENNQTKEVDASHRLADPDARLLGARAAPN